MQRKLILELQQILQAKDIPSKIHEWALIPSLEVPFSEHVRKACEANYCGCYGKYWTCPPGVGDWRLLESRYKEYTHCFVYSTRYELEESFDVDGMHQGRLDHNALDHAIHSFFAEKDISFAQLGTEGCSRCKVCTYPDAPCRFPEKMSPSVEACGIDVVSLSAHCDMHYINGVNTVTYFSAVFFTL